MLRVDGLLFGFVVEERVISEGLEWLVKAVPVISQREIWTLEGKKMRTSEDEKRTFKERKNLMFMLI